MHLFQLTNHLGDMNFSYITKRHKCTDTYFDPNKLANVRQYTLKCNCFTDAEKGNIKEQVIADIQLNETVALQINVVNEKIMH